MLSEERHKRSHMIPEQGNLDSRLVVVRDWKKERMWSDFTGYKVSFAGVIKTFCTSLVEMHSLVTTLKPAEL